MKNNKKLLNNALTSMVMNLHDQGYTNDFLPVKDEQFFCIQDCESYSMADLNIRAIDQGFDQLTNSYKYIHTIETCNGSKGLLFADLALADAEGVN